MNTNKCYSELCELDSFEKRFEYLKIKSVIGDQTFGGHRELNQILYKSLDWKNTRRAVMLRDNGCDLGLDGYKIFGKILIHHINPITILDILNHKSCVFDLENLISTSFDTHNAIHYGSFELINKDPITRKPNDTCPWLS